MDMDRPNLTQPPSPTQLADARAQLAAREAAAAALRTRIDDAEAALRQIVRESRCAIAGMEADAQRLQRELEWARAFVAPIRRLPEELLREIFWSNFEAYPCCAWVLAAVCSLWRRLVLKMPRIWSKIRLVTTPDSSPDTIRLWLERAGPRVPLDIEIFLHVAPGSGKRALSPGASPWSPTLAAVDWHHPLPNGVGVVHLPPPPHGLHLLQHDPPAVAAPPPPVPGTPWLPPPRSPHARGRGMSRTSAHWGHIAMFYLTEHMARWQRFVFRFDRQFSSIGALKSISGDAPLLREFEISCAEPVVYLNDWPWLPSATASTAGGLPRLTSVTLQYVPFMWSSPMLASNLRSITLRALPSVQIYLDRLLFIVAANPALEHLALHFHSAQPAVLPLSPTALPALRSLSLGGHYLLGGLLDALSTPALDSLALDIEPRESLEDAITGLLARSGAPPLTHLALSYGGATLYYAGGGPLPWTFLAGLDSLRALQVGQTSFEALVGALAAPDEDQGRWICPHLAQLSLKSCHPHGDGVSKLVMMVEARNPPSGASAAGATPGGAGVWGAPAKLRCLEMYDCAPLGEDILKWLRSRIDEVKFTEPVYPRSPRSPSYGYL